MTRSEVPSSRRADPGAVARLVAGYAFAVGLQLVHHAVHGHGLGAAQLRALVAGIGDVALGMVHAVSRRLFGRPRLPRRGGR